ncbi:periplasmic binding protein-like II [Camillea tinctor]|nr:periplasmic binding protein-like II [Camillea tinctor]
MASSIFLGVSANALGVLEWTPSLIAQQDYLSPNITLSIVNGGIASLFTDPTVDLGANSETQLLLQAGPHAAQLRTIYTIAEVYYRLVARADAGVSAPSDLRGKRIGAARGTSAEYFVRRYLAAAAGLSADDGDYEIVSGAGCLAAPCAADSLPGMLAAGRIDALGIWEPAPELAIRALGAHNAVVFGGYSAAVADDGAGATDGQNAYRELYNIATTAEKLGDPATRAEIVGFLRALGSALGDFRAAAEGDGNGVIGRVAQAVGVDSEVLRAAWPVHRWTGRVPPDMVDFLVREDAFVAAGTGRREELSREEIEGLVDGSVLEEALGGGEEEGGKEGREGG